MPLHTRTDVLIGNYIIRMHIPQSPVYELQIGFVVVLNVIQYM